MIFTAQEANFISAALLITHEMQNDAGNRSLCDAVRKLLDRIGPKGVNLVTPEPCQIGPAAKERD